MRIYIKSLEPLENRYTIQWKVSIPNSLKEYAESLNKKADIIPFEKSFKRDDLDNYYDKIEIVDVEGDNISKLTEGTFLNFIDTNLWKSSQLCKFIKLINSNLLQKEDLILIADAWDPTIIQLKYIFSLTENLKNIRLFGIWHAGSYDPNDFLGRVEQKSFLRNFERSIFYSLDKNIFATNFHVNLFSNLFFDEVYNTQTIISDRNNFINHHLKEKILISGQPHETMVSTLENLDLSKKENIILFPHRIAPEKQLPIFEDLSKHDLFKDYKFIVCQKKFLNKDQYHALLKKSKLIFSANLQETLGIIMMEGILTNNLIAVPDRLSYSEMYEKIFRYPSEWTLNYSNYIKYKNKLIEFLLNLLKNYENLLPIINNQKISLKEKYLSAKNMYKEIFCFKNN